MAPHSSEHGGPWCASSDRDVRGRIKLARSCGSKSARDGVVLGPQAAAWSYLIDVMIYNDTHIIYTHVH